MYIHWHDIIKHRHLSGLNKMGKQLRRFHAPPNHRSLPSLYYFNIQRPPPSWYMWIYQDIFSLAWISIHHRKYHSVSLTNKMNIAQGYKNWGRPYYTVIPCLTCQTTYYPLWFLSNRATMKTHHCLTSTKEFHKNGSFTIHNFIDYKLSSQTWVKTMIQR